MAAPPVHLKIIYIWYIKLGTAQHRYRIDIKDPSHAKLFVQTCFMFCMKITVAPLHNATRYNAVGRGPPGGGGGGEWGLQLTINDAVITV